MFRLGTQGQKIGINAGTPVLVITSWKYHKSKYGSRWISKIIENKMSNILEKEDN